MSRIGKSLLYVGITLSIFSVARLFLFIYQYDTFAPLGFSRTISAFIAGIRFDISVALTFLGLPLFMMNLPARFAAKDWWFGFWAWLAYLVALSASFLLASDVIYFDYVDRHISNELLLITNDAGYLLDMATGSFVLVLLPMAAWAAFLFFIWKKTLSLQTADKGRGTVRFVVVALLLFIGIRGTFSLKPINIIDAFVSGNTDHGNLTLNGVFTAYHSTRTSRNINHHFFEKSELSSILGIETTAGEYPLSRNFGGRERNGLNIIFFLMENWGFDYIDSFSGGNLGLTPNFDALADGGIKFVNFYAVGQRSILGIQATLTGVPPIKGIPILGKGLEVSSISKLGEILNRNGYGTIFIQSSLRRSFRIDSIAKSMAFDEFYGMEDLPILLDYPDPSASVFGWDYETFMFLKDRLDEKKEPFFAYVYTGTTHTPYPPLPDRFGRHPHGENSEGGFFNTLYYSDWSIGEFMQKAEKSPWFDNTVFIFTADHAKVRDGDGGFTEKFHTPMLIYAPRIFAPSVSNAVGSQLDIMPTVLDILGIGDDFTAMGKSLISEDNHLAFVADGEVVGIISDTGFLKHSLRNRLEYGALPGQAAGNEESFDELEKKLLAIDQASYELLHSNKWAR